MDEIKVGDEVAWTDDYDPLSQIKGEVIEIDDDTGLVTIRCFNCSEVICELYSDQLTPIRE